MDALRVVVWATGGVGSIAVRAIDRRPDLALVGVWAHDPGKVGRDAGDVVGGDPIGVTVTGSPDDVLALRPDCVAYCAAGPGQEDVTHATYETLLRAGINVVSVSTPGLVHPPRFDAEVRDRLTA